METWVIGVYFAAGLAFSWLYATGASRYRYPSIWDMPVVITLLVLWPIIVLIAAMSKCIDNADKRATWFDDVSVEDKEECHG